jgi:hypothetical protein
VFHYLQKKIGFPPLIRGPPMAIRDKGCHHLVDNLYLTLG